MKRTVFLLLDFYAMLAFRRFTNAQTSEQKTTDDHRFCGNWKVLNNPIISSDGKYSAFEINPQKGDGKLVVKTYRFEKRRFTFARGYAASFSPESDFIVYKIKQPADSIRSAKKKKVKKELMPKDSIGILVFKHHKVYAFPNLKQFSLPKENAKWVAFLTDMKKQKKKTGEEDDSKKNDSKAKKVDDQADQKSQLVLFNAASGDTVCFQNISEYYYAPLGHSVTFIRQTKDSLDRTEVLSFDTETRKNKCDFRSFGYSKKNNNRPARRTIWVCILGRYH